MQDAPGSSRIDGDRLRSRKPMLVTLSDTVLNVQVRLQIQQEIQRIDGVLFVENNLNT